MMKSLVFLDSLEAKEISGGYSRLKELFFRHILLMVGAFIVTSWLVIAGIVFYFEQGVQGSNITSYWDALWWGVVTFLTVGYGDRFPVTSGGRLAAGCLMVAGVTSVGIITAKISSIFLERALRDRRGLVDEQLLKNHLIICGWKEEMLHFVLSVLEANPGLSAEKIVLVNNVPDEWFEVLQNNPKIKNIKSVKGDFFSKEILERAAPQKARKVLILADTTPSAQGQVPTATEADARTIMTAMTLSNIAKGVPVVAEILDGSMDQYLKLAHVNEVVYSRDYSRLLMAKASEGEGIPNIIHNLLDPHSPYRLTTRELALEWVNKPYLELSQNFQLQNPGMILIGILENSGNAHKVKEGALKIAQQTPDVRQLVENLKSVKSIRFNSPIFNPLPDYMVQPGSLAIVIESKRAKENLHVVAA